MFYEEQHRGDNYEFVIYHSNNIIFPLHLHRSFEFLYIAEGDATATIDEKEYHLNAQEGLLIFPHQVHSYSTETFSKSILIIFSPDLVGHFSTQVYNKTPITNKFSCPPSKIPNEASLENIYQKKAFLYTICGELFNQTSFIEKDLSNSSEILLIKILEFVSKNFEYDCTLKKLVTYLKYDYVYISKFFKAKMGMPFNEYVNRHRIHMACYKLNNSDKTITDIALECGYNSVRTFNREFKKMTGYTPSHYK